VIPADRFAHMAADLRYAFRMVRKTPGASAVAVLSLALGIGANTAIFSIVDTMLLKLLPVRSPGQLYQVSRRMDSHQAVTWNYPDYRAFRESALSFAGLAAYSSSQPVGFQLSGLASKEAGTAELAYASQVSGNYFDVLGVGPALGHLFNAQDDRQLGGSPYVVLSYEYWQRRFAGDASVIGRTIRLNGYPCTVVGVAQRGFRGLDVSASPNVFVPMTMRSEVSGVPASIWNTRHYWWFQVVGRLRSVSEVAGASTQLNNIYRAQEEAERRAAPHAGLANAGQKVSLLPAARGYSMVRNTLETPLLVLMVVVGLVLLIACANVASLMLARAAARQKEMAVRIAIGASRWQLVRQLLAESIVLALLGGIAGLGFAYGCVQLLLGFVPRFGAQIDLHVVPDVRLLAFTLSISMLTGILFGLAPALQATRPDLVPALKDDAVGSRGGTRVTLRRWLVVTQVALSLLLLVGAGLFVRTLQNLRNVDLGFTNDRTTVIEIDPSRNGYRGQRLRDFYERLRSDVEHLPGVRSASLAALTPLSGRQWNDDVAFEGYTRKPGEQTYIDMNAVGPRYFETLGIPLVLGRDFRLADDPPVLPDDSGPPWMDPAGEREPAGPRVAIITESVAKQFFEGRNPIGLHLALQEKYDPAKAYEIVGVVKDVRYRALREGSTPMVYLSAWRGFGLTRSLSVRTARDEPALVGSIHRLVTAIDPAIPILDARTLRQEIDNNVVVERLVATISGFFGLLALLLAAVGLYGVVAYIVSRRTREIGIRMALGAERSSVLWLVIRDAGLLVVSGVILGLGVSLALTRLIAAFLFGVTAQDAVAVAAATLVLLVVAVLAALIPARAATRVQPTTALRYE
jgi:predicted permease